MKTGVIGWSSRALSAPTPSRRAAARAAKQARARQQGLDRSRRNTNAGQYALSVPNAKSLLINNTLI
ncbi:MAG: hypothetical protein PHQ28_06760 [Mycobacterium sp.]|nr:hypothetical protein [Mycobacterium sp.]